MLVQNSYIMLFVTNVKRNSVNILSRFHRHFMSVFRTKFWCPKLKSCVSGLKFFGAKISKMLIKLTPVFHCQPKTAVSINGLLSRPNARLCRQLHFWPPDLLPFAKDIWQRSASLFSRSNGALCCRQSLWPPIRPPFRPDIRWLEESLFWPRTSRLCCRGCPSPPGVNFINALWAAFTCADPKSAKNTDVFFALLGSAPAKAARKMLMKLTPGYT